MLDCPARTRAFQEDETVASARDDLAAWGVFRLALDLSLDTGCQPDSLAPPPSHISPIMARLFGVSLHGIGNGFLNPLGIEPHLLGFRKAILHAMENDMFRQLCCVQGGSIGFD